MKQWEVLDGDCVEVMRGMPDASVDAVVTDPPYGLEFMGKSWDRLAPVDRARMTGERRDHGTDRAGGYERAGVRYVVEGRLMQEWHEAWAREAFRVLKPGGHLLAFGGSRTYHRMACAVEDAGFEVRDQLQWLYGSGFPKALDVSKAIDKAAGADREVLAAGAPVKRLIPGADQNRTGSWIKDNGREFVPTETAPATPEAQEWEGWATALKPAHEPIVMARKPLAGTVAANVLTHGTGAINVDGCRIAGEAWTAHRATGLGSVKFFTEGETPEIDKAPHEGGRWPANVLLDPEAAAILDEQSGELQLAGNKELGVPTPGGTSQVPNVSRAPVVVYDDRGGASRFFYTAKASSAERNAGLAAFEAEFAPTMNNGIGGKEHDPETATPKRNTHPTVKPIELMRWLVRLVTPPGGLVLDPFAGSGTTGCAAVLEGARFVGIERGETPGDPRYAMMARARIAWWSRHPEGMDLIAGLQAERERQKQRDRGQLDLFGA